MTKFKLWLKRIFGNRFVIIASSAYTLYNLLIAAKQGFWLIFLVVLTLGIAICLLFDLIGFLHKKFI